MLCFGPFSPEPRIVLRRPGDDILDPGNMGVPHDVFLAGWDGVQVQPPSLSDLQRNTPSFLVHVLKPGRARFAGPASKELSVVRRQ